MDRACRMPTAAEALCSTAVNAAPTRMPSSGWEKAVIISRKPGSLFSGATAPLMSCMPNISTAKPSRMSPTWWWSWRLENMRSNIPVTAITAARVEVEKSVAQLEPETLDRAMIQPVMLVPIRAPWITGTACFSFIMPEFTKPTTITEVAEEDWIMAVTPVPSRAPRSGVPVSRKSTSSILLPATRFSPSPIRLMPKRNRATPPSKARMFERSTAGFPPLPTFSY